MTSPGGQEAPAALDAAISSEVTAGAALRRAREARGLHIAALAATLKVPQSKLEALEGDRYKELPDATFARALARSMCRALKIDAEPVLAMLPRGGNEASLDRVTPGLNQPFRERAASQEPMVSMALLKNPVLLGGAALLVAALAVYLVPSTVVDDLTRRFHRDPETSTQTGSTTEPAQAEAPMVSSSVPMAGDAASSGAATLQTSDATAPAVQSGSTPGNTGTTSASTGSTPGANATTSTAPATNSATTSSTTPSTTAGASTPPAAAVTPTTATPTNTVAGTAAPASAPVPAAAAGLLRVRATGETWVEVVDSQGQTLLSRLMRSGEQVDLNGAAPLKLRVGNVSATELVFRGKPVDLAARARDNVARLELN